MKKLILTNLMLLLFMSFTCSGVGQNPSYEFRDYEKKYATVFLDYEYFEPIEMITPEGKTLLRNDSIEGRYIHFSLLGKGEESYDVIAWDTLDDTYLGSGTISNQVPLGICSRQYNPHERPNKFYSKPDYSSPYELDTTYIVDVLRVFDFNGTWLKVEYEIEGVKRVGWFPPEMQCANVYSTCS